MAESSSASRTETTSSIPTIDEFAETLQEEERWYQLGIFMGAPISELNTIHDMKSQRTCDILMLLIQLYDCLERKGRPLTWEAIATALRRLGNHALAEKIHSRHHNKSTPPAIVPQGDVSTNPNPNTQHTVTNSSSDTTVQAHTSPPSTIGTTSTTPHTTVGTNDNSNDAGAVIVKHEHCPIFNEYHSLDETFNELLIEVKDVFMSEGIRLDVAQDVLRRRCGLPPLTQEKATPNAVFTRVEEQCSIINFRIVVFLVKSLELGETLLKQLDTFKGAVDRFKSSANMVELVDLIKSNQTMPTGDQKMVKLKVREFWSEFTMEQFEIIINEIFLTLYDIMTHVSVTKGCICLNWSIPDIDTTELLPVLSVELVRLIGVIYLHIGSDIIYNIEGEGCESIEAAMIQAIELKNTRAIELLLAVGCNPEVASYNGDNTVTNIVNIKQPLDETSSSSSTVPQYLCVLGHNEHVEAIIDPDSVLPSSADTEQCDSCRIKDKILKQAYQEMDYYRQTSLETRKGNDNQVIKTEDKTSVDPQLHQEDRLVAILKREKQILLRELAAAKDEVIVIKARSSSATKESCEHFEEPKIDEDMEWKRKIAEVEDDELAEILASTESEKIPFVEIVKESSMRQMWLVDENEISFTNEEVGSGAFFNTSVAVFCGARVAAKRLLRFVIGQEHNARNRYIRSICLSSVIHHPNILQFIGATHYSSPRPVLLYELMHCNLFSSLFSIAGDSESMYSQALDVGHDIGSALYYLHSFKPHPIIHRNVSYTTILANPLNNGKWTFKLSGFESANFHRYAIVDKHIYPEALTAAGYAAPETVSPQNLHSPAVDVYSLGVVLIASIILPTVTDYNAYQKKISEKFALQVSNVTWEPMQSFLQQCTDSDYSKRPTISEVLNHVDTLKTKFKSSNIN